MSIQRLRMWSVIGVVVASLLVPAWIQDRHVLPAIALMLIVGLPHGATDYALITKGVRQSGRKSLLSFLGRYLAVLAAYALIWYFLPGLALLIFVAASVYHFGQSHWWQSGLERSFRVALNLLWGSFVLLTPLLLRYEEAAALLYSLLGAAVPDIGLANRLLITGLLLNINVLVLLYAGGRDYLDTNRIKREIINLFLLFTLYWFAPLLVGLAVFFVLWHSWQATREQMRFFAHSPSASVMRKFFLRRVIPSALLSVGFIVVAYFGMDFLQASGWDVAWVFIFVALVTLPHILVVEKFYTHMDHTTVLQDELELDGFEDMSDEEELALPTV